MTYLDTLYLSDTAICARCGTDLLIEEATFCPMCGEVRVPGPSAPSEAGLRELVRDTVAAPTQHDEGRSGLTADVVASPDPTGRADPYDSAPPASPPMFDTVDDDAVPATSWAESRDVAAGAEGLVSPLVDESPGEHRHFGAGARLSRLGSGDLFAAAASGIVAISLFLPWFQQKVGRVVIPGFSSFSPGQTVVRSADALGVGAWHWAICVISSLVVVYVAARTYPGRNVRLPLPHWQMLTVVTGLNAGLVLMSVGLRPDSGHWSLAIGAYLAVVASLIALGGALLRRGDPEVISPGLAWRAARAAHHPRTVRTMRPDRSTRKAHGARTVRKSRPQRAERETRAEREPRTDSPDRTDSPYRTDFTVSSAAERSAYRFSTRAMARDMSREAEPEMDEDLECRFCGTVNSSSARVCRGCCVVTTVRLER